MVPPHLWIHPTMHRAVCSAFTTEKNPHVSVLVQYKPLFKNQLYIRAVNKSGKLLNYVLSNEFIVIDKDSNFDKKQDKPDYIISTLTGL